MQAWLINLTTHYPILVYGVIILLTCVEGPIMSMLGGLLFRLGYLSFVPLFIALVVGDLIGDSVWYFVGHHFGHRFVNRFGKYVGATEERIKLVTELFHKHKERILILSKITNGFGLSLVILLTAGMTRVPFSKYIMLNAVGEIIWTGVLVGIGYFFGNWYLQVNSWMGRIGIGVAFVVIVVLFTRWVKYSRSKVNEEVQQ